MTRTASNADAAPGFFALVAATLVSMAALLFAGCNLSPGGGTDVGNPEVTRVSGSLLNAQGKPVPWIQIQLRPKNFLPDTGSQLAAMPSGDSIQNEVTDTQGFFTFDSVPKGDYRIQAFDADSHGATLEFAVDGKNGRMTLSPVIMDTTGSISGKVIYRGPPKPFSPKLIISVFGTDRWTAANAAGEFTLSDLPPGRFTLRITTPVSATLIATVPETPLAAGGNVSVGTVDLGP